VDNIGRRVVRGPATVPLEAVAMLAMALPIALVFILQAKGRRSRALGSLAACLLLAATVATFRKTALLLPLSVIATLIWFRGRQLLKFAPLGLVLLGVVHLVAPGALSSTSAQLGTGRLNVPTVSDRAIDYDAVRPDVWSHLLLGRGWGTYDHHDYRILDSEILQRLIEMGVVGLIAYFAIGIAVIYATRLTIRRADHMWSPLALIGAASAISFLVASCLFDVLSFPHATYIFLYMAGLTAVVVAPPRRPPEEQESERARRAPSHTRRVRTRPPAGEALTRAPSGRGSARR
jgi:O-antigen ligase